MAAPMNMTLYRLLVQMGASEPDAEAAARVDTSDLATKADLAELKASLLMWMVGIIFGAMSIQTGLLIFVLTHYARP